MILLGDVIPERAKLPESSPDNMSHVLSRYREYLRSYYSINSVASDDKLSIAPCSQFISLALVKKEGAPDAFSRSTFHSGVDEIIASKTPLEMDALVTPDSRFVLVEGPPGIGKSTLCWELCRQWDTLKSLQHYKIVLQLKLRERRVQNATEINDLFYHKDKKLCQGVVDEVLECEGEGVLLILDGFDEMPKCDKDSLIMELIGGTCLPKAARLVTSRPSALHRKGIFPRDHRNVEILGFTDERKVEFAGVAFKSEPDVFAHFKDFIFSNPIINSLMYIPINCAIITQVYKDIKRSVKLMPKTMTQLYTTLVLVLIRRHMIEKGKWDEDSGIPMSLDRLPEKILSDLEKMSELAYRGLVKEETQLVFTDSDVGKDFQHLGLLSEAREMYVCEGAKSSYSFHHLSIQEFLAAWHIARNSIAPKYYELPHLRTVMKFVAGFCCGFPRKWWLMRQGTELMVHCLYEAQNLNGCVIPSELVFSPTNPLDMYAFGYVLALASTQWVLHLREYLDVSQLVNSCMDSGKPLGHISGLAITVVDSPSCLSKLEELPICLCEQIIELYFQYNIIFNKSSCSTKWMSLLHNLHALHISGTSLLEDKSLLYQTIESYSKLKELEVLFDEIPSIAESKLLSESIASSHTLERLSLMFFEPSILPCGLVESALSCSTLKTISTNIPFLTFADRVSPNLESITFRCLEKNPSRAVFDCLCCIADLCKMPSMRSLKVTESCVPFPDFWVILNHSLHCNSSFTDFNIHYLPLIPTFSITLRPRLPTFLKPLRPQHPTFLKTLRPRHPSLFLRNRSKSLSDLSTACGASRLENLSYEVDGRNGMKSRRWQSCPDLQQLQFMHNMHPLLCNALGIYRLHLTNICNLINFLY